MACVETSRPSRRLPWLLAAAGLLAPTPGCSDVPDRHQVVARNVYDRYCSECHGRSADGYVPVEGLGFQPADLRKLRERYGRPLRRAELHDYIDGRHSKPSGETRLMPVWGDRLYQHLPDTVEVDEMRAGTIELLIDHLESIQE